MSQNWVTNLDLCAMNGVLDYDAGAYLRGLPPRYIGNPTRPVPPMSPAPYGKPALPPPATPVDKLDLNKKTQQNDKTTANEPVIKKSTPIWKKLLFAAVTLGSLIFIGYKCKNTKFMKSLGKFFKKPIKSIKTGINKFWNWIKKPFSKTKKP